MTNNTHEQDTNESPWWLEEGMEQCFSCEQRFHSEALMFCLGCDGPVCSHCATVTLETRESFCTACNGDNLETVAESE